MKLAAIIGSPHGMKGNTGQLLGGLLQAAERAGAAITTFSLGGLDAGPREPPQSSQGRAGENRRNTVSRSSGARRSAVAPS